ncbi:hypothetical protein GCM10027059_50620 [Myceligenerans halotolerans]
MGRRDDSPERVWHQLGEQQGRIQTIDIEDSPVFAPGTIELGQFTLLVGLHGSGKTYLLNMLHEVLPSTQVHSNLPPAVRNHPSMLRGRYQLAIEQGGEAAILAVASPPDPEDAALEVFPEEELPASRMLSPFTVQNDLAYVVDNSGLIHDVTAGHRFESKHLKVLRRITGRNYDWLEYSWYEEVEPLPYLRGERDGVPFDSSTMSHAEHWVTHVLWHLEFARAGDLVLIDEPETFLAAPGHRAFIDEIARRTLDKKCQAIVVTHAEAMIGRVPPKCVRQVTRGPDGARVSQVGSTDAVLQALSLAPRSVTGVAFVEDVLAARMARRILERHGGHRAGELDIIASGGNDVVAKAVDIVGRSQRLVALGILDGDQRSDSTDGGFLFLPGAMPEEELLKALTVHAARASRELGVPEADLHLALDRARFVNHQRVFSSIGMSLGRHESGEIADLAIDLWLEDPGIDGQARQLAQDALQALRRPVIEPAGTEGR